MKKSRFIYVLSLIVLLSGCIKEDLEDCYTYLYFSYLGDGTQEIFPQKIEEVNLYIYNESGSLVETIILDKNDLNNYQGTSLFLPDGKYRVVCWGNSEADTQINGASTFGSAIVAAPRYFTKQLIYTNDSLYIGSRDIEVFQYQSTLDTVYFSSAHIKMMVEIDGLEDILFEDSSPVELQVGNLSPTVDFTKRFSSEKIMYYPLFDVENNTRELVSRFNVLRYNDNNDVFINLVSKETGQTIYSLKLSDFMKANNITVDNINEAFVGIRFRFNGTNITVTPWDEEIIRPGM